MFQTQIESDWSYPLFYLILGYRLLVCWISLDDLCPTESAFWTSAFPQIKINYSSPVAKRWGKLDEYNVFSSLYRERYWGIVLDWVTQYSKTQNRQSFWYFEVGFFFFFLNVQTAWSVFKLKFHLHIFRYVRALFFWLHDTILALAGTS